MIGCLCQLSGSSCLSGFLSAYEHERFTINYNLFAFSKTLALLGRTNTARCVWFGFIQSSTTLTSLIQIYRQSWPLMSNFFFFGLAFWFFWLREAIKILFSETHWPSFRYEPIWEQMLLRKIIRYCNLKERQWLILTTDISLSYYIWIFSLTYLVTYIVLHCFKHYQ